MGQIVADDADSSHAVVQLVELSGLKLAKASRNDPCKRIENPPKPLPGSQIQAVCHDVATPEDFCVGDEVVDCQADGSVVRSDDGSSTNANNAVEMNSGCC